MTGRRLVVALVIMAAATAASPLRADATVAAVVTPTRAVVGDTVNLTVTISGDLREVSHPTFSLPDGLRLAARDPQVSQRLEIVNGRYSRSVDFTYMVVCAAAGTFTVGGISVSADGGARTAAPVGLTVLPAGEGGQGRGEAIRLEAALQPSEAFEGQSVAVVVRLFVPRALIGNGRWGWVEQPKGEGFLPEAIGEQGGEWRLTTVDGVPTMAADVARYVVTPTRPGSFRFFPGTAKVVVRPQRTTRSRRGFFDSFFDEDMDDFFGRVRGKDVAVSGEAVTLTVKPLPTAGRPATGPLVCASGVSAVAGVSRIELPENETLTYKITVEGQGDLRALPAPTLDLGGAFRVFESKATPTITVDQGGVRSRTVFEYVLVPLMSGALTLPPVAFPLFDPLRRVYDRVVTKAVVLTVTPGEREDVVTGVAPGGSRTVTLTGRDINYIDEDRGHAVPAGRPPLHGRPLFWALTLLPVGAVLADAWGRGRRLSAAELASRRASRALREARAALAVAASQVGDGKAFYSALRSVLVSFVADKLGQPAAGLVLAEVRSSLLEEHGVAPAALAAFEAVLEVCDLAAFSPALPDAAARDADLARAREALEAMERGWGR